jgi:hypothetical protein
MDVRGVTEMTINEIRGRSLVGDTDNEHVKFLLEAIDRLQTALDKTSDWAGVDLQELIDEGYINEDDI